MDELIREFENKLRLEGKSDTTIKSYITSVNVFSDGSMIVSEKLALRNCIGKIFWNTKVILKM